MKNILTKGVLLSFLCMMVACSPKIRSVITSENKMLAHDADVFVFNEKEMVPENIKEIGKLSLGDSGFTTKCTYEIMIEKAKYEARKSGANIVKITEHKYPSTFGSTCHRLKATMYYTSEDINLIKEVKEEPIIEGADYALLHVYRYGGVGPLISYNLKLGDSVLCRVRNNFKTTVKIKKEGLNSLIARTESKKELPIDVEFGKHYYLRCSVDMGVLIGRPHMDLVDYKTGSGEFEHFEARHDETKE